MGLGYDDMIDLHLYGGFPENSGFSPQIIQFHRVFHYKPSILGYPYFWGNTPSKVVDFVNSRNLGPKK